MLVALLIAASGLQLGLSNPNTIAKGGHAKEGLTQLEQLGHRRRARCCRTRCWSRATDPHAVAARARRACPTSTAPSRRPTPRGASGGTRDRRGLPATRRRLVARQGRARRRARRPRTRSATTSGSAASPPRTTDFIDAVYGNFPLMIALIAVIVFVLLARAFRSLLLPAKAVVLNVVSVLAAWGVLTLVWQNGHGSDAIWGIPATGSITAWIPLMVFAFLFGLSMDYEVFILARDARGVRRAPATPTRRSIRGIGRTGRLVTSAALILFLAFMSLASEPGTGREGPGHRIGRGHPARRHGDPRAPRPRRSCPCSAVELVDAAPAGEAPARRAVRDLDRRAAQERVWPPALVAAGGGRASALSPALLLARHAPAGPLGGVAGAGAVHPHCPPPCSLPGTLLLARSAVSPGPCLRTVPRLAPCQPRSC